jgi:hypothetical protein
VQIFGEFAAVAAGIGDENSRFVWHGINP